jgi:FIST N domain
MKTFGAFTNKLDFLRKKPFQKPSCTAIVLVTNNFKLDEISRFLGQIESPYPVIGGVVDSIYGRHGWSITTLQGGIPFYRQATLKKKTVGRRFDPQPEYTTGFKTISKPSETEIQDVNGKAFFTISDSLPFEIYDKLAKPRIGIVAAQTIFTTGKPYTMFYNNEIVHDGTVGLAFDTEMRLDCGKEGLYSISDEIVVTKSQGNIIVQLGHRDASKLLVDKVHLDKSGNGNTELYVKISIDGKSAIVAVTGGDISRGTLAVDTKADIKPGSVVEFFRRRLDGLDSSKDEMLSSGITLSTLDEDHVVPEETKTENYETNGLNVCSYGGVFYGDEEQVFDGYQFSNIPGRTISLKIS